MITRIDLRRFKCFETLRLPLHRLTFLSGLNTSGKRQVVGGAPDGEPDLTILDPGHGGSIVWSGGSRWLEGRCIEGAREGRRPRCGFC